MCQNSGEITHVSDTALMVAAVRAHETELEDAFVRDPFAARLAGERGIAILNATPHAAVLLFGLALRTRFLDELLMETLAAHPITTVLSVGCGLDTRPWRLELPAHLRWIEVDFAPMLDYKDRLMAAEDASLPGASGARRRHERPIAAACHVRCRRLCPRTDNY